MNYRSLLIVAALTASAGSLLGCRPDRHEVVPSTAHVGAEGNERLTFTTDGPGTIYVVDESDNKLLYSGHAPGRRQVVVDPERNEIMVDGALVQEDSLRPGNTRKIYFRPTVR